MSIPRTHVIFNPASAAGATGRRREEILAAVRRHIDPDFSFFVTNGPHEATGSAREAARRGTDLLIAVGGDGTIQEVVNGLFSGREPLNPRFELGFISAGTGQGLAQSLGWPLGLEDQCAAIGRGIVRRIDIGRVLFADGDGRTVERYFVNECQAGIGGEVVKKVQAGHKRFGGLIAFGLATLQAALRCPNRTIAYSVDDGTAETGPFVGIVAANGHVMAGGMKLAPRALIGDGRLDILLMRGQTPFERLRNFPKIYSGKHLASPKFGYLSGRSLTLSSREDVPFEADGELFGRLPCRIEVLPGALKLRTDHPAKG